MNILLNFGVLMTGEHVKAELGNGLASHWAQAIY